MSVVVPVIFPFQMPIAHKPLIPPEERPRLIRPLVPELVADRQEAQKVALDQELRVNLKTHQAAQKGKST